MREAQIRLRYQVLASIMAITLTIAIFFMTKGNVVVAYLIGVALAILEYWSRRKKKKLEKVDSILKE